MILKIRLRTALRAGLQCAVLAMSLAGCAVLRRGDPVVDRSEDGRIRSDVEARLLREPGIGADQVRVEVDGRIVILHGSVRGLAGWQCAIRNASLVPGVQSVTDFLVIQRTADEVPCLAERSGARIQQ